MEEGEFAPKSIAKAYEQTKNADDLLKALLHLRRVLLMETGRVEARIQQIKEQFTTLS